MDMNYRGGMWEGGGGQDGEECGGEWDNCNSITINILKKDINNSIKMVRNFNNPLSIINKTRNQKINKKTKSI